MISPSEIKQKAATKYLAVLRAMLEGQPFERLEIRGSKSYTKSSLSEFEREILSIRSQSKEKKGFGYSLAFQQVKTKYLSTQDLPISIYFDTEKDFLQYLGKEKEAACFLADAQKIISAFPELKDWAFQNPHKIILNASKWDSILRVCSYFKAHPRPQLYVRELPIQVHTKFIQANHGIIQDLLNTLIPDHLIPEESRFDKRFNLKYLEPQIRFRILDKDLSRRFFSGLDDMAIPQSQFEQLDLPLQKAFVVENKTSLYTTLTLPQMHQAIAIFGSGYSVSGLKGAAWLHRLQLLYWGDLDAQGFEILSQFRGYFPHAQSMLMDKATFDKFFENDTGKPSSLNTQLHLTPEEDQLYQLLKTNNWRLEQEKIPCQYVNQYLEGT